MGDKLEMVLSNTIQVWNELLKPRTIFAFMIYCPVCYLTIVGQPVPEILQNAFFSLMGFYFGQRVANNGKDKGVGL